MDLADEATTINTRLITRKLALTTSSHWTLSVWNLATLLNTCHMYALAMQALKLLLGLSGPVILQATSLSIVDSQDSLAECYLLDSVGYLSLEVILVDLCGPSLPVKIYGLDGLS